MIVELISKNINEQTHMKQRVDNPLKPQPYASD